MRRLYSWLRRWRAIFAVCCCSGKARAHFRLGMFYVPFPVYIRLLLLYCHSLSD